MGMKKRATETARQSMRIRDDDDVVPLLDVVDLIAEEVREVNLRATAEAVLVARNVVLPGLTRGLFWPVAVFGFLCVLVLLYFVTPIVTFQNAERKSLVEQTKADAEHTLEARVEQIAGDRLRACEVTKAAAIARADEAQRMGWAVAIQGRDAGTDAYVRAVRGLDAFGRSVVMKLQQSRNANGELSVIAAVLNGTPAQQRRIYDILVREGVAQ